MSVSHTKQVTHRKLLFASGLVLLLCLVGLAGMHVSKALAHYNCDSNAIEYCGFSTKSNFIKQVKANSDGMSHHDLQAVYKAYGLEPSSYDRFVKYARWGTAYQDGRIVVDGQVVATGARSIGRLASYQGSGYFTQNINGVKYYGNTNSKAFASTSIPVVVLFNSKGVMQFAVLNACGNPESGNKVVPVYSCNALQKSAVANEPGTYKFATNYTAKNNASVAKMVYDFGDGATKTVTSNFGQAVEHTYAKSGTYTAKVDVYVNLPGKQQIVVPSEHCQTTFDVAIPFYNCVQLAGAILDKGKMSFEFVATANFGNGATFTGADFDFGDGTVHPDATPSGSAATVDYTYAKPGNYDVSATLHFNVNGQTVTAPTCKALVTPTTTPTPECKPGIPVGDIRCNVCKYNASLPANSKECVPPPASLPNTGAGNTIALGAVMAVGGFLAYRQIIFRKHRAAFLSADRGSSPRLDQEAPFVEAPEERAVRSTFRRRRPF